MQVSLESVLSALDFLRARVAWYFQPYISNWLIAAAICGGLAFLFLFFHAISRPERKIDWDFERERRVVTLSGGGEFRRSTQISGLFFSGTNISGHALHQISATITQSKPGGATYPLYIGFPSGGWGPTSDVEVIPEDAFVTLGIMLDGGSPGDQNERSPRLTADQFLSEFGAFQLEIVVDDAVTRYGFSVDELRAQLIRQEKAIDKEWRATHRPSVKRKIK